MTNELNKVQKSLLLARAKKCAKACSETLGWDFKTSVQGAIDDTADDREYYGNYDGPRIAVYSFLDSRREEIEWVLWVS